MGGRRSAFVETRHRSWDRGENAGSSRMVERPVSSSSSSSSSDIVAIKQLELIARWHPGDAASRTVCGLQGALRGGGVILFVVAVTSASQNVKNSTPAQPQLMKTREPHKKEKHLAKELKEEKSLTYLENKI